jgi:phosphoenolpyruvate---glycerone phosphotransferase subunit DhaM
MVNLLIVSHSAQLAAGVQEFASQVAGDQVKIAAAGGAADGSLGTSVELIQDGLQAVASPDGVLILVDMGSAVISVETVLEVFSGGPTLISDAPLVEGAYLAALEATAEGATLEQVAAAALQARELIKVHK